MKIQYITGLVVFLAVAHATNHTHGHDKEVIVLDIKVIHEYNKTQDTTQMEKELKEKVTTQANTACDDCSSQFKDDDAMIHGCELNSTSNSTSNSTDISESKYHRCSISLLLSGNKKTLDVEKLKVGLTGVKIQDGNSEIRVVNHKKAVFNLNGISDKFFSSADKDDKFLVLSHENQETYKFKSMTLKQNISSGIQEVEYCKETEDFCLQEIFGGNSFDKKIETHNTKAPSDPEPKISLLTMTVKTHKKTESNNMSWVWVPVILSILLFILCWALCVNRKSRFRRHYNNQVINSKLGYPVLPSNHHHYHNPTYNWLPHSSHRHSTPYTSGNSDTGAYTNHTHASPYMPEGGHEFDNFDESNPYTRAQASTGP